MTRLPYTYENKYSHRLNRHFSMETLIRASGHLPGGDWDVLLGTEERKASSHGSNTTVPVPACVCGWVGVWERERERESARAREREIYGNDERWKTPLPQDALALDLRPTLVCNALPFSILIYLFSKSA